MTSRCTHAAPCSSRDSPTTASTWSSSTSPWASAPTIGSRCCSAGAIAAPRNAAGGMLAAARRPQPGRGPTDAVLVPYLGHFDVLLARLRWPRRTIALDHLVSGEATARDRGESGGLKLRPSGSSTGRRPARRTWSSWTRTKVRTPPGRRTPRCGRRAGRSDGGLVRRRHPGRRAGDKRAAPCRVLRLVHPPPRYRHRGAGAPAGPGGCPGDHPARDRPGPRRRAAHPRRTRRCDLA